jgi:osmoprotectant transport system ATP-binding protein
LQDLARTLLAGFGCKVRIEQTFFNTVDALSSRVEVAAATEGEGSAVALYRDSQASKLKDQRRRSESMPPTASLAPAPAIDFRNVSFALPNGTLLLDSISLTLDEGTTTAVLGRSGSGKTTLLRTVNRLLDPTSGEVFLGGQNARARDLITLRRSIGYVIQEVGLFPHFTLERNVSLVLEAEGVSLDKRIRRSHELLTAVGLDPATFARRYPRQLSGGQRQRAGLARALAADPPILLMDEPFGALDPLTRLEMQQMMRALLEQFRKTVLLVTHDLDEALYLADRIVLLDTGRALASLTPEEFLHSTQPEVRAYVQAFRRERPDEHGPEPTIASPIPEAQP